MTNDAGAGGRPVRVRPHGATPEAAASQVLVRRTGTRRGLLRRADYEVAYYPEGLATSPSWVRRTASLGTTLPGSAHPTDLHDLRVLVEQAWDEGEDRFVAWPVWYPAVARKGDLRRGGRVLDGLVHELSGPDRTRCGLTGPGLTRLGGSFHRDDPRACSDCAAGAAGPV